VIFAELKATGKKLRPIQELRKKELEKLGFDYWIVDSYEEIDSLLNYIKVQEY